jgi:hypothetical protein
MKFKLTLTLLGLSLASKGQVTIIAGDHRVVNIGDNAVGDYARSVILLHEIYNGAPVVHNFAVGTITAMRGNQGAYGRLNSVTVKLYPHTVMLLVHLLYMTIIREYGN